MIARLAEGDVERLSWFVQESDGFMLLAVSAPGTAGVGAALQQLKDVSAVNIVAIHLTPEGSAIDQLDSFANRTQGAIAVLGLDDLLSPINPQVAKVTADELNWSRNALVRLNRTFILFLSPDALRRLANSAPDFFDYRTGVFQTRLVPDARFWLYDRISPQPIIQQEIQSRLAYWNAVFASPASGPVNPRDPEGFARVLISLGRISEAEKMASMAEEALLASRAIGSTAIWVNSLRADILDAMSLYGEALELYEQLVREAYATAKQDWSLLRRLEFLRARAGWYVGHDDSAVLSRLQNLPSDLTESRTRHLMGMVMETLEGWNVESSYRGEGEALHRALLAELSVGSIPAVSNLTLSCAYHAARDRLTLGDLSSATHEIQIVKSMAETDFGVDHDAFGFALLLEARCGYSASYGNYDSTAREGLRLVTAVHGIESASTLDAVVQVREMSLDPLEMAKSFLDAATLETASEAWTSPDAAA